MRIARRCCGCSLLSLPHTGMHGQPVTVNQQSGSRAGPQPVTCHKGAVQLSTQRLANAHLSVMVRKFASIHSIEVSGMAAHAHTIRLVGTPPIMKMQLGSSASKAVSAHAGIFRLAGTFSPALAPSQPGQEAMQHGFAMTGEVVALGVQPAMQGQKYGRLLLQAMEASCKAAGEALLPKGW